MATVAAGRPGPHPLTDWDRACGFQEGDDVVGVRREEDRRAVALLGARPVWFDFLDVQYGPPASSTDVAWAVEALLRESGADLVAMPVGLHHPDHLITARACGEVAGRTPQLTWLVYEDVIYRRLVSERTADGFALRSVEVPPVDLQLKREALERYATQLHGLGEQWLDGLEPERYWELVTG